jgi:hypothetical protein
MAGIKPPCARCRARVDRIQPSFGLFAAYPCNCWLREDQAESVRRCFRELVAAADARVQVD